VVALAQLEHELAQLRAEHEGEEPVVRASTMTHVAWVPERWLPAARATLAGLGERHPSRTILLLPNPDAENGIATELSVQRFGLPGLERQICTEVIELRLGGETARVPASVVLPLLRGDLPVFLRWRGRPPFGAQELEQLVDICDRLIVDSSEWERVQEGFAELERYLDRAAVSDIAWARLLPWRLALAARWPGIATVSRLDVRGPQPEARLLAGWLRSRLGIQLELELDPAVTVEAVSIDGEAVDVQGEDRTPSLLLSEQLDVFGRDAVYESALRAAR
jgi:hypothetical protein